MESFEFNIRNGIGFPVGVYSPIGIFKLWQDGRMQYMIPKQKNVEPLCVMPDDLAITQYNIPERQEGVEWLVTDNVKDAFPFRDDFLTMLNVVTDSQGNIRGCLAFA